MKLIWNDYLIIITLSLMIIIHFMTQFALTSIKTITQNVEEVNKIFTLIEINPFAVWTIINARKFSIIFQFLILPAFALGNYFIIRKSVFNPKNKNPDISRLLLDFITIFSFSVLAINFLNDLSVITALFFNI